MHTTAPLEDLRSILEFVARISTKHLTLPALQSAFIEAKGSELVLRGTNLELGIEGKVAAVTKEEGIVCVSASTLLQTVSLIDQKEVILRTEGDVLIVETKTSKTSINTTPTDDFPHIPKVEGTGQTIPGKTFAYGIKTAAFAASQSSIKPELGSVYLYQKKEHTCTFVATDSFRLVEKTVPEQQLMLENPLLIPYKNAVELGKICDSLEENPKLYASENQCALEFTNVYITSRLTAGTFPDYNQIIPKEFVTHTTLLAVDLQNALKKTSIFLNKFMQLTIALKGNAVSLTSKGDFGTTTETLKAVTEGDDITLNFNQRYIQEILPYITDESITIHFAGIGRPIVIEGVHDRSLRYLVMPMNK
jgi:DNA polymerase III subunit beta